MDVELGASTFHNGLTNGRRADNNGGEETEKGGGGRRNIILAYRTLGVVFGGLVTSPLYVYPSMNLKSPKEDDYLGIYSIMFWTLTLIGVVKYTSIALNADDHGEGGTFALYSLLCSHTNIGLLPSTKADSGTNLVHPNPCSHTEKRSRLGTFIEQRITARRILLFISMLGMCMLIGDGILTPAISVLSAIDGLRGPLPKFGKSAVEAVSAVILIGLFLLQKYGTSRVSFLFSPIMAAWTFTTPIIGIYSFLHYYPGAEAMFADLGHFNKRSIQIAFLFTIYPSLVLTYAGQTAYLIRHPDDHNDGFYKFVPTRVYWPMFIIATLAAIVASQSLISATFSVIKQSVVLDYFPRVKVVHTSQHKEGEVYSPEINYILMVLCVAVILGFGDGKDIGNAFGVVVIMVMLITTILLTLVMIIIWRTPLILVGLYFVPFFIMEGAYVSAVTTKIVEGGWFPFAISMILAFVMFGWYYGRQRKIEYEVTNKITLDSLAAMLSTTEIQRVPGLCFFYSSIQDGLPPILGHYIKNMRSLHKLTIFTTLRYLLVAKVPSDKRIIIRRLGTTGVYGCTIQYGYADSLNPGGDYFVTQVTNSLRHHIEKNSDGLSPSNVEEDVSQLEEAISVGMVYVVGKTRFHLGYEVRWFDKILLGFYEFLHNNCRSALPAMSLPLHQRMEMGMFYKA